MANCVVVYPKHKAMRSASGLHQALRYFCHQLFNGTDPLPGVVEIQQLLFDQPAWG